MTPGLPYFTLPSLDFGEIPVLQSIPLLRALEIQPFGILVATGVLLGAYLMRRWGETHGLDDDHVRSLISWTAISGFIGAHVFDVLAYQNDRLASDPLLLLRLWDGISSYGGFIGGTFGLLYYARKHRLPLRRYTDMGMVGITSGFTLGRLGCTIVHDHIGAPADDFFLATYYSREVIREHGYAITPGLHHNLGFYEFLYMLALCGLLIGLARWRRRPDGLLCAAIATAYAPVRFFLDFLRHNPEADPRYVGLTFAQWMSLVVFVVGLAFTIRILKHPTPSPSETAPPEAAPGQSRGKDQSRGQSQGKPGRKRRKHK